MTPSRPCRSILLTAIVVATSSFGTFVHAADLGSLPSQAPVQTWTGFSLESAAGSDRSTLT